MTNPYVPWLSGVIAKPALDPDPASSALINFGIRSTSVKTLLVLLCLPFMYKCFNILPVVTRVARIHRLKRKSGLCYGLGGMRPPSVVPGCIYEPFGRRRRVTLYRLRIYVVFMASRVTDK